MPVTASTLPAIAFSQNEINLVLTSDDIFISAGVRAETNISFYGAVAEGYVIELKCPAGDFSMTAADVPDDSGKQFPTGDGGAAYVASLVEVLKANYELAENFTVVYMLYLGAPTLRLTAKKAGVLYTISDVSAPPINVFYYLHGVNKELKPNFAHHVQLLIKKGVDYEQIWRANLQLDSPITGTTTKNIAPLLHPYLVPGFANSFGSDKPSLSSAAWQACTNTVLEYKLIFAQFYGEAPTVKKLKQTVSAFVNLGGLDIQTSAVKTLVNFLRPDAADDSKTLCLRQGSKLVKVQPAQPEFLYWLNLTGSTKTIKVKFELFFNEGGSVVFYSTTQSASAYSKNAIAVGYTQANVIGNLPTGKTPAYYTACIVNHSGGAALSTTYTYVLDAYKPWPRFFVYRNAIGGFQTLYTWGKGQQEVEINSQTFERLVTDGQAAVIGRKEQTDVRMQDKFTVYTGYTTRRDIKLLKDFFASGERYLVHGTAYVPVLLGTDSLKEAPDGDNLNGASFEYLPKYDEMVFTDDPTQQDNDNTAVVPALHPIYFYMASELPANESDLASITPASYADTLALTSGTIHRMVVIGLQSDKSIDEVLNTTAGGFFGDITNSFKEVAAFSVGSVSYKFYALVMGVPFPTSQNLEAVFI